MSLLKANAVQLGQSLTASQNFTLYQPAIPDGTFFIANGNSASPTNLITVGTTGNLTFANSISLSAASTKTLTLNGGAGSNGLVLTTANAVGIGTASPLGNLSISATNPLFAITNGNSVSYSIASFASDNTLRIAKYGVADFAVFDSSGNLGLGVTPSAWGSAYKAAQIGSQLSVSYSGGYAIFSNNAYNNSGNKYIANDYATQYYQQGGQHVWGTAASGTAGNAITFTQAMTLTANGELLVGGTNTIGSCKASVVFTNGTNNGFAVYDTASSGTANMVLFYRGGSQVGSITSTSGTTAFNPTSDISLKENIKPITNGLERVAKLKPVDYNWKSDGVLDNGFIAQDLLATEEFAHRCNALETKEDGTKIYGVDYMKFVAVLTAAIQELSAEIETLKQRIK